MKFYKLISDTIEEAHGSSIALLGGGGKTALLHKLAEEFAEIFPAVLQTSLTKTAFHPSDNPFILKDVNVDVLNLAKLERNPLFVIGEKLSDEKLKGISALNLENIQQYFDISIFECDGARNKPLKAHTDYDPNVPDFATHCVVIVGADVVNKQINDGLVHRPELFCKNWDIDMDYFLNSDFIVKVLTSKRGYLSKVQNESKVVYFVNKWDQYQKNAEELAKNIYKTSGKPTFYGSIQKNTIKQVGDL